MHIHIHHITNYFLDTWYTLIEIKRSSVYDNDIGIIEVFVVYNFSLGFYIFKTFADMKLAAIC